MMDVKYTKVALDDPEDRPTFNYSSVFTYDKPDYFSYGKPSKDKYRSAFTYQGISNQPAQETTIEPPPRPSLPCVIWAAFITVVFYGLVFITFPVSFWFCFKRLPQHERLVVFRLGRMLATKGPGIVIILPLLDRYKKVDLRTKAFSIPPHMIMTSDGCTIEVGADVMYHVKNATMVVACVQDLDHTLRNKARTCMQEWLGKYILKDIQSPPNKRTLQIDIVKFLNESALPWGIEVTQLEMSTIKVLSEGDQQPKNPLEVLKTMFSGSGIGGGNNPMQHLASQFMSQMQKQGVSLGGTAGAGVQPSALQIQGMLSGMQPQAMAGVQPAQLSSIQPHLQPQIPAKTETLINIEEEEPKFKSADELLEAVQPHLSESLVKEFGAIFKFVVHGPGGGIFYLDLKNGCGRAEKGEPLQPPDVTLTVASDDLGQMLQGQLSTFHAYMSGRLQVDGDTNLASRLSDLIEIVKQNRSNSQQQ